MANTVGDGGSGRVKYKGRTKLFEDGPTIVRSARRGRGRRKDVVRMTKSTPKRANPVRRSGASR